MAGNSIGSTALILSADDQQLQAGLDRAGRKVSQFKHQVEEDGRAIQRSVQGFNISPTMLAGGAGVLAGFSISGLVGESIKLAAEFEDSVATFKVLTGSMEKGKALLADIKEFANFSPFTTRGLMGPAASLLGVGYEATNTVPLLRILGDLAQGDEEKLKRVVDVFGQVKTAGMLTGETLHRLNENQINLVPEIANILGVGTTAVKALTEEGLVSGRVLEMAAVKATGVGGRFYDLMTERSQTYNGLMSTMKDSWEQLLGKFGQAVIDEFGLKSLIQDVSNILSGAGESVDSLRPFLREAANIAKDVGTDLFKGMLGALLVVEDIGTEIKSIVGTLKDVREGSDSFFDNIGADMAAWAELVHLVPKGTYDTYKSMPAGLGKEAGGGWLKSLGLEERYGRYEQRFDDMKKGIKTSQGDPAILGLMRGLDKYLSRFQISVEKLSGTQEKHVKQLADEFHPDNVLGRQKAELDKIRALGGFVKNPNDYDLAIGQLYGKFIAKNTDFLSKPAGLDVIGSAGAVNAQITAKNQSRFTIEDRIKIAFDAQKVLQEKQLEEAKKTTKYLSDLEKQIREKVGILKVF